MGSYSYESCCKVSQGWETGWQASMEMGNENNKSNHQGNQGTDRADGSYSFGDSTIDYSEIEVNYSWPFADEWTLQPGGIYHWSNKSIQPRPYLRVNYKATPDLASGLRYRYNYNTYGTVNSTGKSHRGSANRLGLHVACRSNAQWNTSYQGTVYRHISDDYKYKDDKSPATENTPTLRYKWNGWFSPYIEYDYLGKQGCHDGQNEISESQYRIDTTLTL